MAELKPILALLAAALTIFAFVPYIRKIKAGTTLPHVFSWIIWGMATLVVFIAQLSDGAAWGAWPVGLSGLITLYIAWLAWQRKGQININQTDRMILILALSALPLWLMTSNPLWAVVILTLVDTLGFIPSFRKAWHHPYEDSLMLYAIMALRNALVIAALQHYSATTVLFPATILVSCVLFVVMVSLRRSAIR